MADQPELFSPATGSEITEQARDLFAALAGLEVDERIDAINAIRLALAEHSPMRSEPVDCVVWVDAAQVEGNSYNPNVVAPPELKLLKKSIIDTGFTQPIVAWREDGTHADGAYEVVDGFHRHKVAKEDRRLRKRLHGRLPLAVVNDDARTGLDDRMAATVRHNAARGKHTVDGLAELVLDLHRQGKTDQWICTNLGMDPDEVVRLRQTQGLAQMFADQEFSEAWTVEPFADGADEPDQDRP